MSADQIKVRRKETPKKNFGKIYIAAIFAVVALLGAGLTFSLVKFSDGFAFSEPPLEISAEGNRNIIRVPAGGNLQSAIDRAKSGDIIELQAGATYREIVLPNKTLTDFITIQSSAIGKLAVDARVSPAQSALMAKIVTRTSGKPAVETAAGANRYRFIGIEFASETPEYIYNLVYFGTESPRIADVPRDLEIDRCYFRPHKSGVVRRGLALNSANTVVKNSYFEGFAFPGEETQGICGWTGTKNVRVLNNYVEGGAENVMFGGSDPANAELIPQDIEVRGNHFKKPAAWKDKNSMKCLFELKNAKRVQFVGNFLEDNWLGSAFRITVRNDGGKAEFSTLEDILVKDNIIRGAGEGINILGKDDIYPSQRMKNLIIVNNLFLDIDGQKYAGSGAFIKVSNGENILIANNTVFNQGNIATFHGEQPVNFVFRDNITGYGEYGIHGLGNPRDALVQRFFQNNLFVNNRRMPANEFVFPPNNFAVQDFKEIGFTNAARNDFRLSQTSKFKAKGKDKTDLGFDPRTALEMLKLLN